MVRHVLHPEAEIDHTKHNSRDCTHILLTDKHRKYLLLVLLRVRRLPVASVVVVVVVVVCNRSQMRTSKCRFNFWCEYRS